MPLYLTLLASLLSGGNDLLDSIESADFWEQRDVPMTVAAMAKQLQPQAIDLTNDLRLIGADDPEVRQAAGLRIADYGPAALPKLRQVVNGNDPIASNAARILIPAIERSGKASEVRKLIAIRTLGELRDPAALQILTPLTASKEPFVAEYAEETILALANRRPEKRGRANADADLHLIPKGCRAVVQFKPASRTGRMPDAVKKAGQRVLAEMNFEALQSVADAIGNVRLESVTIGLSGEFGQKEGFIVLVARGRYDSENLRRYLHSLKCLDVKAGNTPGFEVGTELVLLVPSDDQLVVLASPGAMAAATEAVSTLLADGKADFPASAVGDYAKKADRTQPIWGIVGLTDEERKLPGLAGIDWITCSSAEGKAGELAVRLTATGRDLQAVHQSADAISKLLQPAVAVTKPSSEEMLLSMTMEGSRWTKPATGAELLFQISPERLMRLAVQLCPDPEK